PPGRQADLCRRVSRRRGRGWRQPGTASRPPSVSSKRRARTMPKIESVDLFYVSMPVVEDISDGSQDALLVRVQSGDKVGWGEAEASPLPSIASWIAPMSRGFCHPIFTSVLGEKLDSP